MVAHLCLGISARLAAADQNVSGNLTVSGSSALNGGVVVGSGSGTGARLVINAQSGDAAALKVRAGAYDLMAISTTLGAEYIYFSVPDSQNQFFGAASMIISPEEGINFGLGSTTMSFSQDWFEISYQGNSRLRLDAGKLGINTPTPTAALDVVGNAKISGTLNVSGAFSAPSYSVSSGTITGGTTGLSLVGGTSGNQNITLTPLGAGSTILNGRLGINDGSPAYTLDLYSLQDNSFRVRAVQPTMNITALGATNPVTLSFTPSNGGYGAYIQTTNNNPLIFKANGFEGMRVKADGTVQIWSAPTIGNGSSGAISLGDGSVTKNPGSGFTFNSSVVASNSTMNGGSLAAVSYNFSSDSNTGIYSPASDNLGLVTAGSERLRIDSSGKVGIGTTIPSSSLHVVSSDFIIGTLKRTTANGGSMIRQENGNGAYWTYGTLGTNTFSWLYNSQSAGVNELMTLTPAGGSAPTTKLSVAGNIQATGSLIEKEIVFTPNAAGWWRVIKLEGQFAAGTLQIFASNQIDGQYIEHELQFSTPGYGMQGTIVQTRGSTYLASQAPKISAARVSSSGAYVFVDLYVRTPSTSPITLRAFGPKIPAVLTAPVLASNSGDAVVQIGLSHGLSSSSVFLTDVATNGQSFGRLIFGNWAADTYQYPAQIRGVATSNTSSGWAPAGLAFYTGYNNNPTEQVRIDENGKVGIGTSAPSAKLHVAGTARFDGPVRIAPQGDLSMGEFTAEPQN